MTHHVDIRYGRWNGRVLGLLGMGPRFSGIDVTDDDVVVRMGWAFRTEIGRSSIASVTPDDDVVWGWGVHGWRGKWLVNGSSHDLIRIELAEPVRARVCFVPIRLRVLRVSVTSPDDLIAHLA